MLNTNFNRLIVKSRLSRFCRGFLAGKTTTLLLAILFAAGLNSSRAQDTWTQKTNFGGAARQAAVSFSIGSKGYIGTGYKDFWEYDPSTNAWTQKSDFGGTGRWSAVGFSIGSKGYIGTGNSGFPNYVDYNDFWEYNPATNAWTQKANFGGTVRANAVGFSIGSKGYIGAGDFTDTYTHLYNDFWEYDPASNAWTQKANFGGSGRYGAVGFSIGAKGYIGTGYDFTYPYYKKDFWEYDPASNAWTEKANFAGTKRYGAVGFSIGSKGYIGTGLDATNYKKDFWEYDPITNAWTQRTNFGGSSRFHATGFSVGTNGYIGTGSHSGLKNDFWEYTPATSDTSTCAVPSNLSVTNITSSSANLNWDSVSGAQEYKVRYKVTGTSQWTLQNSNGNLMNLNNLSPNTSYTWEVKTYCIITPGFSSDWSAKQHFTTGPLRIGDESVQQTSFQIYPNPAGDHATIQFALAQSSHVCIKVYDVIGKEIETLLHEDVEQGEYSLVLNTNHFPKGVYLVKMISPAVLRDGIVHGTPYGENQKLIVQ